MRFNNAGKFILFVAVLTVLVLVSSVAVSANPGPTVNWYDDSASLLSTIFMYNLPINLLWFSAALAGVCYATGKKIGRVPKSTAKFLAAILAIALIVTILGVLIDFTMLFASYPVGYVVYYNLVNWTAAACLIFSSVYLSSALLLDLDLKLNVVPALAMAVLNPVWWTLGTTLGPRLGTLTLFVSLSTSPVLIGGLWLWHRKMFHTASIT